MVSEVFQNKWVRAVGLLGAVIGLSVVMYLLSSVLVPLFFAFAVAYIFDPVIDWIERFKVRGRHVSRVAAIVTLVGSLILASILLPLIVLPGVIEQAENMINPPAPIVAEGEEPSEDASFRRRVAAKVEDLLALDSVVRTLNWVPLDENGLEPENPDSIGIIRHEVGKRIADHTGTLFQSFFPQWRDASTSVIRMLGIIGDSFLRLFLFIGNFVLFAFVAIYLLKDYDHIVAACDELVPHRYRSKTRDIMRNIDRQLRSFLRGQFTVCCCLGAMYAIGFMISGAPFALMLALMGALGSFVPYLGLILTIGPAVALTVLYHGAIDWHVAGVLATFAIAQFLEGNFLTPRIVGSQVGLGPVWVILAIMVFSSALGFVGLLLAVPIAAVLKVLAGEALDLYRESAFFSEGTPAEEGKASRGRKPPSASSTSPSAGKGRRLKKV